MKKILYTILLSFLAGTVNAQFDESHVKDGYELRFISQDPSFSPQLKTKMINAFFDVYPKLAQAYNPKTAKKVTFVIDTAYKGVAATANDVVSYSARYMATHTADIDVVTHEVMHIVQGYGNSVGPWWLTEGIADYARYKFGIDNAGANWSLPEFKETQKFDNGYRVTARFLLWVETKVKAGTVQTLDAQLRDHTFTDTSWKQVTGSTLEELWKKYQANPSI